MPLTEDLMRDCLLDALSQHVLTFDRPGDMVVSWADMKRRTLDVALVRGLFEGMPQAFEPADDKLFDRTLWSLFSEGLLAPVFKTGRYGPKGWQENEFKLTARGMRGFAAAGSPTADVPAFLEAVRRASGELACREAVLAFADEAVRAAQAKLVRAAAEMTRLALEPVLAELGARGAHAAEASLRDRLATIPASREQRAPTVAEVEAALAGLPDWLGQAEAALVALRA